MNAICIIPARGGSKRIPRKNVRRFLGKPIISYSIDAAKESGLFGEVMVSTDDEEIASISRSAGAEIPFMRSRTTADDKAPIVEVILEVLDRYMESGAEWDLVGCVLPTAPFLLPEDIRSAYAMLTDRDATGVFTLARFGYPIQRAQMIRDDGFVGMVWPEHEFTRSQDLPPRYYDAGQFYLATVASLREHRTLFAPRTVGYELPESRVQDIDTESDWEVAELKYRMQRGE